MEITWLGHSAVRIGGSQLVLVTDPYDDTIGVAMPKIKADVVSVSHDHPHHSYVEAVEGDPRVLSGPGEYEIANFYISGMGTARHPNPPAPELEAESPSDSEVEGDGSEQPDQQEQDRQVNTVYTFRGEGLTICHLGAIGRPLAPRQTEALSQTDVLIIPVGGHSTIDVDKAAQLVSAIEPRIVIPVHYRVDGIDEELEPVERFLGEVGATEVSPQSRLSVTATNLPRDMTVVVLQKSS
ncbi:MAG: MBL fold metallo-hydrolase [Chloroflexi bacterium]|nr:MBL fold metallo-hydrolase [Chloroflexota bacterium]